MTFGQHIRARRKEIGLTQEELGERIGIQKSGVAKYENDRIENPKRSMLQKFADALEVDVLTLMGWGDEEEGEELEHFLRTHVRSEEDQELVEEFTYLVNCFSEVPEVNLLRMSIKAVYETYNGSSES